MSNFDDVKQAIQSKACLTATYRGSIRHFSPHALGTGKDGSYKVLGYQYAGTSNLILPNWKCFDVNSLLEIKMNEDDWHTDPTRTERNTCIKNMHITSA